MSADSSDGQARTERDVAVAMAAGGMAGRSVPHMPHSGGKKDDDGDKNGVKNAGPQKSGDKMPLPQMPSGE
ncbi:hypothetical protein [Magnetospirillum molischianum]|uniref:Uncharacterized protein n=1 Tax=Magnetospirillum molischianum DSM 120 TaxID=1150626 RepID=H8FVB7_MAGML|nr:hypothetical protein [Magnetospirillum molischianum]CCG42305.1 hypothetical protein PHAMO_360015 [Magnetospirillum molischianum DSM 120]